MANTNVRIYMGSNITNCNTHTTTHTCTRTDAHTHTQIHITHTHRYTCTGTYIHTHTTTHHTLYSLIRVKCFELRKTKTIYKFPIIFYYYYNLCHYYISSSIIGFISKVKAQECLNQRENGTFLLRFSDSECGGITIAWIAESQTNPGRPEQVFTVG